MNVLTLNDFMMEYKSIIYMKVGYHTDEELDEIIVRKIKEDNLNYYK